MTVTLRPDQARLQADIFTGWNAGQRNILGVLPTGGGKSVIVSDTVRRFDDDRRSSLVMAHRQELVGQMSMHLARQQVRHRIIAPKSIVAAIMAEHRRELNGNCYINPSAICAVAGVDTLVSRLETLQDWLAKLDLLVCDEAHHVVIDNKWGKVFQAAQRALGLGVTATPQRTDMKGLGRWADGVFDGMALGPTMRELIIMGALCDYEIVCPESDFDLDSLVIGEGSGEYTQASLKAAAEKSRIVGDVVENYYKHAYGKRAVVFATDVATSNKMAEQFRLWGIPAASISAKTEESVRNEMIRRLRDGRLWVLVNVDLLGEGFDLPAIEVVIMARPTASLVVFMQQFGRALRTMAGKAFGLVIDHVSNIKRHKFPDVARRWTLDRRQKRKKRDDDPELIEVLVCKWTGRPYEAIHIAKCPHCGLSHVKPPGEGGGLRAIEVVAGDLTRLDAATLQRMREAAELETPDDVRERLAGWSNIAALAGQANIAAARIQAQAELKDAIAHWAGYQRDVMRRDDSEIHRRFYHAVGSDVLSVLTGDRKEMEALTERVREWISA